MKKKMVMTITTLIVTTGVLMGCGTSQTNISKSIRGMENADIEYEDTTYLEMTEGEVVSAPDPLTKEDVAERTGFTLATPPEGAEYVSYYIFEPEAENPIAELEYILDDNDCILRVRKTDMTEFTEEEDGNICGIYYTWDGGIDCEVSGCPAHTITGRDVGVIIWLDAESGTLYNFGMTSGASNELLIQTAEQFFAEMQDDTQQEIQ